MSLSVKIWIALGIVFMFIYGALTWFSSTALRDAVQAVQAREQIEHRSSPSPGDADPQASGESPSPEEQLAALKSIAARASARAPYSVGDGLLFLGADALMEGGRPVYHSHYEMTRHTAKDFTPSKATLLKLNVMPRLLRKVCNSANVSQYLAAGSAMAFDYTGSDGKLLLNLVVDKSNCEGFSQRPAPGEREETPDATTQNGAKTDSDHSGSADGSPQVSKPQTRATPEPAAPSDSHGRVGHLVKTT